MRESEREREGVRERGGREREKKRTYKTKNFIYENVHLLHAEREREINMYIYILRPNFHENFPCN